MVKREGEEIPWWSRFKAEDVACPANSPAKTRSAPRMMDGLEVTQVRDPLLHFNLPLLTHSSLQYLKKRKNYTSRVNTVALPEPPC